MDTVCELLNPGWPAAGRVKTRQWVMPGIPCFLGNNTWLQVERVTDTDTDAVRLQTVLRNRGDIISRIPACAILNLTLSVGMRIIPRAIERNQNGPQRIYLEFTRSDLKEAAQA